MNWRKEPTLKEQFLKNGFFFTSDSEVLANLIMELRDRDICFRADDPGDYYKYCIIKCDC